jgi:hypothetical protein
MKTNDFDHYLDHVASAVGHVDRVAPMKDYCAGLMLPLQRKSVEPLAAHLNPQHVSAKHQSLLHFVGQSDWSDQALLNQVLTWVQPLMEHDASRWFWIVDDTGFPKKGKHSSAGAGSIADKRVSRTIVRWRYRCRWRRKQPASRLPGAFICPRHGVMMKRAGGKPEFPNQ